MKKTIVTALIGICALPLCACGTSNVRPTSEIDNVSLASGIERLTESMPEGLSDKLEAAYNDLYSLDDYPEYYSVDKVAYFGEYDGAHVVYAEIFPKLQSLFFEVIDGVVFNYSDSTTLDVFYNGTIYKLRQAYNEGLLTHDDLLSVQYKFNCNTDHTIRGGIPVSEEDYNSPEYTQYRFENGFVA